MINEVTLMKTSIPDILNFLAISGPELTFT